jgi:hypothetical protein
VADRKRKGVRSADTNYQPLKKHITEFAPKIRLWEVNSRFLEDFVEHMCTKTCPRSKKNYAKKTVTDIVENLGVVMKAAIAADIPVNNPVPLMDRSIIHGDEKPRSYLTMDEVMKLRRNILLGFYLRPKYIFRKMGECITHPSVFLNYCKYGIKLVVNLFK